MRLSLKAHPMAVLRPVFARDGVATCADTAARADARFTRTAGLVLVRQRPGKGNAIFITLEDETGITNVVLWARQFERFRREVMAARLMLVEGRVQRSPEGVTHLMATRIVDRSATLDRLWGAGGGGHAIAAPGLTPADEGARLSPAVDPVAAAGAMIPPPLHLAPAPRARHPRDRRVLLRSRDFH
jgi:error-prone DNA polymerase